MNLPVESSTAESRQSFRLDDADENALLFIEEVASIFRCSEQTVRRLARTGKIPAPIVIGNMHRWRAGGIREFLKQPA
jgi:excisionase family DNA binding protein